jgi:predicted DNA-binding protein (MmcQ/YjbR family)
MASGPLLSLHFNLFCRRPGFRLKTNKMIDGKTFRNLALGFGNTEEQPHFHRQAFRVKGKTIFATLDEKEQTANLKLTEIDQSVFCAVDNEVIHPVAGAWGRKGWTTVDLKKVQKKILGEMLKASYEAVAKKKK